MSEHEYTSKNGPRTTSAVLASRYWLTEKGEAAVAEYRSEANDDES